MSQGSAVALFSAVIVFGAIAGAVIPLFAREEQRLVSFLSFAAGVMLGAAFFHMLPEAFRAGGYVAFFIVPLGFLALFFLERYVLVHACEEPPDFAQHAHGPVGLAAFLGLSAHTLFDGIALGSAVTEGLGAVAVLAIAAHKVPSSFSLASIFRSEGKSHSAILLYATAFGLMVPLGAPRHRLGPQGAGLFRRHLPLHRRLRLAAARQSPRQEGSGANACRATPWAAGNVRPHLRH
jgi:zinc and cadmium transporter